MITFNVKNSPETEAVEPLPTLDELKQAKRPDLEIILVSLGYILTAKENITEWIDLEKIIRLCKKHWKHVTITGYNNKADFRLLVAAYFEKHGDIKAAGLKVLMKQERVGDRRDLDYFFRFHRLNADGSC